MADKDMMAFQGCTNSENVLMGPYDETYAACQDGDQAVNTKAEEISDTEEEVDPVLTTFQEIKVESEVSFLSLCVSVRQMSQICRNSIVFEIPICVCLSVYEYISYILDSNLHLVFAAFLNEKKLVHRL
jgi:hypothetical protein